MDVTQITQLIGSLGFPIVMCLVLMKYVREQGDKNAEAINKITESHKQETYALQQSLDSNTAVLSELKAMFEVYFKKEGDGDSK